MYKRQEESCSTDWLFVACCSSEAFNVLIRSPQQMNRVRGAGSPAVHGDERNNFKKAKYSRILYSSMAEKIVFFRYVLLVLGFRKGFWKSFRVLATKHFLAGRETTYMYSIMPPARVLSRYMVLCGNQFCTPEYSQSNVPQQRRPDG